MYHVTLRLVAATCQAGGFETIANLPKRTRDLEEFMADFHFDKMLVVERLGPNRRRPFPIGWLIKGGRLPSHNG